jgi:hypothetical protein
MDHSRPKKRKNQDGIALVFAMLAIIVILGSMGLVMTGVQRAKKETDHAYNTVVVEEAAQAGIDLAVERLWNDYIISSGNTTGNVASYKYYLNNTAEIPINEDLNFNGVKDPGEEGNGDAIFDRLPAGVGQYGKSILDEPLAFKKPGTETVIATIEEVTIARYDTVYDSRLTVRSTASLNGATKTAVQVLRIGGSPFDHGQFAILANNISCILCHAEIRSLELERNTDPSLYGTFDRVKIAALESLMVRTGSETDSRVAGSVYTRGRVYQPNGNEYTASGLASTSFDAYAFSSEDGKIRQNATGAMSTANLANAAKNADGELAQFANLYLEYPEEAERQTDGPLPGSFPAPYPDEDGDRIVDDEEFQVIVNTADGSIDFELGEQDPSGAITNGVAYGVPEGGVYTGTTLPTSSNSALSSLSTSGYYDGNLILIGTNQDPIKIHNTVAVDGDLVIKGPIEGEGKLLVRGNTYIIGDVTYNDAPGQFGVSPSGETNAFALVSGGSVMMGDYITVRGVNHSAKNNDATPDHTQYSIHTREKTRSNAVKSGTVTETLRWGYFDPYSIDANQVVAGRQGQQFSFTMSELQLFNKLEMDKAVADSTYTPRFYGLRESQPNNLWLYDATDEHAVHYLRPGVKKVSDYIVQKGYPLDILNRAAIHYLNPAGNWMSEDQLRQYWYDDEMTRPSGGRDFKFDGLLYSNNSIFNIVRSMERHKSNTKGKMTIRGGVIAADLGMFVPGGLKLHYDPRVERFLNVADTERVVFARAAFYFDRG